MTDQCKARREQDEMVCYDCGFRWDVDDPDPPKCPKKESADE